MDPYHRLPHPSHREHALYLRQLSELYDGPPLQCQRCGGDIHEKSLYCCEECDIFMHKPCAEAPPPLTKIQHHPRHPQHPLILQTKETILLISCHLCRGTISRKDWFYICKSCSNFGLHISCAAATLPNNKDEVDGTTSQHVEHVHGHPLYSVVVNSKERLRCHGCYDFIFGEAHVCYQCQIFFDKACIGAPPPPREIQRHPFHPQHRLQLILDGSHLKYSCKECNNVAFHMSTLISTLPQREGNDAREDESRSAIHHFAHEHMLNPYYAATKINYDCCKACDEPIVNEFYGCIDCSFLIHESCVQLPSKIQHYLHTNHPLSLVSKLKRFQECESCADCIFDHKGFAYKCETCDFALHMRCARKTLVYLEEGTPATIQHFSHQHKLTLHLKKKQYSLACYGCAQLTEGPEYWCYKKDCKFFIHKSCVELPSIIQQSSDSHPLTLRHEEYDDQHTCCACGRKCGHLMFSCAECELNFDATCAPSERPTLKERLHEHDLFYVAEYFGKSPCKVCGEKCRVDLFRCLQCRVSVHYDCIYLLSKTIESNFHVDRLTLYESAVEDDSDENGCDICEGTRDPELWAYCCIGCQFFAHVKCATSSTRPKHVKENHKLPCLDEEIWSAQQEVDATNANMREKEASLEALREKLEQLDRKHANVMSFGTVYLRRPLHRTGCSNDGLYLRQLSEHYCGAPLECRCCGGVIHRGSQWYCCEVCEYFVHKVCAEAPPPQIQCYPCHPQHPLTLQMSVGDAYAQASMCYLCKNDFQISDWFYRCELCSHFEVHAICAVRPLHQSTLHPREEDDVNEQQTRATISYIAHEHPLNPYRVAKEIPYDCNACREPIVNGFYGCSDCGFLIHESCAKAPPKIEHYLHPNHPLSLVPQVRGYLRACESCKDFGELGAVYDCENCLVALHRGCACKTLVYLEEGAPATIQHFSHKDELALLHLRRDPAKICYGCAQPIVGLGYGCYPKYCEFFIHKSCLELPPIVQQSSHSHPLNLYHDESNDGLTCCACGREHCHFVFSCAECELNFDAACAPLERTTFKERLHEHDLFYVAEYYGESLCKVCGKKCRVDVFRCLECQISVHYDCIHLLSKTIRSNFHVDSLTLYESFVEEDYEENCCDICEGRRDPELWLYYCAECQFFAHVKCALSPVRLTFAKEMSELRQLEKEIECVQAQVVATEVDLEERKASLEPLTEKLKALKIKREE